MKLTQTDRKEIVAELQTKKVTMTELAERYKVSIAAIGYVFKKMTGNGLKPQLSQSEKKAIVAALQSGKTTEKELGATYGVTWGTIGRVYKKETGKPWKPRLPDTDKKALVAVLLAEQATKMELTAKYSVHEDTIERTFKRLVGKPQTVYEKMLKSALSASRYRAWHSGEKKMYAVLGLDWFNQKVLIDTNGVVAWHDIAFFTIMEYSGLRDRKRTPEYPEGQEICVGDIIQFPILLKGNNGKTTETVVYDTVAFDRVECGWFTVSRLDDPLAMHNDECEIIGDIYDNPELISETA